jgi:hypothetical protein
MSPTALDDVLSRQPRPSEAGWSFFGTGPHSARLTPQDLGNIPPGVANIPIRLGIIRSARGMIPPGWGIIPPGMRMFPLAL